ncbi:hypothetical protein GQ600_10262 [Phytophthora cactorum]|nr:hypothetical protein GQ600_10262 [Phytophthora cactorum]
MAELLLRWLNHELELSTHVTDVESDLPVATSDLNVEFDANVAVAIMNEKKDAAANLCSTRSRLLLLEWAELRAFLPNHWSGQESSLSTTDQKHKLFEHSIRRHVRSIALLQQEKWGPNHGRTEEARGLFGEDGGAERDPGGYEGGRLHRAYIHSSFIKEALEETESPAWRLALQKKSAREQRRTAFFQQLMKNREEAEVRMPQKEEVSVDNAIPPFRPYEIRSQLVFADAEWMYILHKFECPTTGRLYAEGLCRASCKQDDEKVSAAKLYDELPKEMPDVVVQLLKWDSSQRIKLEAPTEAARRQDETTTR